MAAGKWRTPLHCRQSWQRACRLRRAGRPAGLGRSGGWRAWRADNGGVDHAMTAISDLAKRAGIAVDWTDATGAPKTVPEGVQRAILERLGLNAASPAAARESRRMLDQTASEAPLRVVRPRARLRTNHKRVRFCGEN